MWRTNTRTPAPASGATEQLGIFASPLSSFSWLQTAARSMVWGRTQSCLRSRADESEDQAPFRMELLALSDLLTSVADLSRLPTRLVVLVDCEAALKAVAMTALKSIRIRGTSVHLIWVPAHGKGETGYLLVTAYYAAGC